MNTGHPHVGRKLVEAWKALFVAVWNLRGRTSISFFNGALFADLQRFAQPVSPAACYGKTHVEIYCTDLAR